MRFTAVIILPLTGRATADTKHALALKAIRDELVREKEAMRTELVAEMSALREETNARMDALQAQNDMMLEVRASERGSASQCS